VGEALYRTIVSAPLARDASVHLGRADIVHKSPHINDLGLRETLKAPSLKLREAVFNNQLTVLSCCFAKRSVFVSDTGQVIDVVEIDAINISEVRREVPGHTEVD
jgi:hypothetical protein